MRADLSLRTDPRLRLIAPLGRGGMSEVWLAAMRGPGGFEKLVAGQQLRPVEGDDRASLLEEARLAARLNHPNIVQTFEVLSQGGDYRIVMEFLEGQPLNRVLGRALPSVPIAHWVRVLVEALAGLHHAHEATDRAGKPLNLVHRDVSPHNVFLTWDGGVKLLDFGIAAFERADRHDRTEDGVIKGKLTYMAPEQALGGAIDRRADIFSVGIILWEILAGRRMWSKMADHLVYQELVQGQLPRLEQFGVGTPPPLKAICEKALAFEPTDRFGTADEMRRALDAWLEQVGRPNPRELGDRLNVLFAEERKRIALLTTLEPDGPNPDEPTQLYASGTGSPVSLGQRTASAPLRIDLGANLAPQGPSWGRIALMAALGVPVGLGAVAVALVWTAPVLLPGWFAETPVDPASPTVCPTGERPVMKLKGEIAEDRVLACTSDYLVVGTVRVAEGATLTVAPGTTVRGDLDTHGTLVVEPGARIVADGAPDAPITFTSSAPHPVAGDWGGLVVLGRAPTNQPNPKIEGLAERDRYGGDQPYDDSGVLRYVRIGYAGVALAPGDETNGLTLAGVGRGTVLDHVLVWAAGDDCFELFGGTVDGTQLVCVDPGDDGFDLDAGYTGQLSKLVVVDRIGGPGDRNAIEVDNDAAGASRKPVTDPRVEAATLCGPGKRAEAPGYGLLVRRAGRGTYRGLAVDGYFAAATLLDGVTPALDPIALAPGMRPTDGDGVVPYLSGTACAWPPIGGPGLGTVDRWDAGWIDWDAL
ncbi:MAG: serine/threonine-protein kinase [Myxococcota bacterium]